MLRLDAKGIVLNCLAVPRRARHMPPEIKLELMTIPHLKFLEATLRDGVTIKVGEQVNLWPKHRDKVKSVSREMSFAGLSKGSRQFLKGMNASEERSKRLAKEIESNPIIIAELNGSLEAAVERMIGSSTYSSVEISKLAKRILRRFVESHLSGKPVTLGDLLLRGIYGPLAKSSELRGLQYQI